jgi:TMEM175 potassium channel family protein
MSKTRLEAFSDGVMAILITIMVLELKPPDDAEFSSLVRHEGAVLGSYVLSFLLLGIYWNNHHHLFQMIERVNGRILWANLHLMFWLSFMPFVTAWVGRTGFAPDPIVAYGVDMLGASMAYWILTRTLIAHHGPQSRIARAVARDFKGKISLALYAIAIPLAYVQQWLSVGLYVLVALIWLIPDRRMERNLGDFARHSSE